MSLYQINPKAFRQGDISVLYANTKLRMPTRSQLGALTTRQAKAVYDTLVPASATVSSFKPVSQKPAIAQPDPQNVQAAKLQQQVQDQQNTLNALATQSNVLQTQVNQLKANQTKAFSQQELLATTNQNLAQGVVKQEQELKALNDQRSVIAADMQALGQTFQATRGQLNEAQKDLLQVEKTLAITQNDLKLAQQKKRLIEQAEAKAEAKAKAEKTTQKLKQAETAKLAQEVQEVKEAKEAKEVEQAKRAQELKQAKAAQLVLADKEAALIEQAEKSPEALPMLEKSTAGRLTTEHIILLLFMLIVFILGALWWAFTRGKKARKVKPKVTQAQAQSRATDKALNTQINVSRASLTNDVNDMLAGHGPMPNDADEPVEYLSHEADMDTKLFLASSYKDMGEVQTAIDILQEVINKGNADQQAQARQLLATIDKA
jgi:FimV-like protein